MISAQTVTDPNNGVWVTLATGVLLVLLQAFGVILNKKAKESIEQTKSHVENVDNAVNHRQEGQPTLVDMVDRMHGKFENLDNMHRSFTSMEDKLEILRDTVSSQGRSQSATLDQFSRRVDLHMEGFNQRLNSTEEKVDELTTTLAVVRRDVEVLKNPERKQHRGFFG